MTLLHDTPSELSIGFIGLGDQGGPMAQAISQAGFSLHVWARRAQSLASVADVLHTVHPTVSALATQCDIVALCLRDDADVWDLLLNHGLIEALRPGAIVINHGTGDPDENGRIAFHLRSAGTWFLDAPVSGGRPRAIARTLTTMVGGDRPAFEQCHTLFKAFSGKVAYMGPSGSGQLAKLLNNALTMTNLKNAVDVFSLAEKLELDTEMLRDVLLASSGSSAILEALGTAITPQIAAHLQGLMRKDIEHFAEGIRHKGFDPEELRTRGVGGAEGLTMVIDLITADQRRA
jgi:3-hydroxyisobutyrate dehydrogenase-like beta-hydroxyacid dehydrogenase